MLRSTLIVLIAFSTLVSVGFAQTYPAPARISPQEASVIADYWIRSYLRRNASPPESRALASQIASSPAQALAGLLSSREYYSYAGGTPEGFMHQLIEDVGHHRPSPYEVEARLQDTAGLNPQTVAFELLREYPRNWWPGPAATPPRELRYFYSAGRPGPRYR